MTDDTLILAAVFFGVLIFVFLAARFVSSRRDINRLLLRPNPTYFGKKDATGDRIEELIASGNEQVRHYFDVTKKNELNSIEFKLIQAGYFSKSALRIFNIIRLFASIITFILVAYLVEAIFKSSSGALIIILSMVLSAMVFILSSAVLERMGKLKQIGYRKLFPDFMDMLIVCVDAGLSIEAAVNRVTREIIVTNPDFGTHLNIMMLEVRAGRQLRDALANFAQRLSIDEAKSLATLFRQSDELGSDVTKALRVFSKEMRELRMIRAEEKANSLPIKMLFPLALFLFPTNLIIVLVPIIIRVTAMFVGLKPH